MAKIGIVGAGQVGATCAFVLATSGLAEEIILVDIHEKKASGEAWRGAFPSSSRRKNWRFLEIARIC